MAKEEGEKHSFTKLKDVRGSAGMPTQCVAVWADDVVSGGITMLSQEKSNFSSFFFTVQSMGRYKISHNKLAKLPLH